MKLNVGFDLEYVNGKLVSKEAVIPEPEVKTINDINKVLKDRNQGKDKRLYYVYKGIYVPGDDKIFRKFRLRFDITIMPSGKLGHEFVKTHGHSHQCGEIYEVLKGEGVFMLHKSNGFYPIVCKKGYRVEVPSKSIHVTSNQSQATLIMCNLMPDKVKADYKKIEKTHGAAYYLLSRNKFVPNKRFKLLTRRANAKKHKMKLYIDFISNPKKFAYLREK